MLLQEAQKGYRDAMMAEGNDPEAVRRRAMGDPEVQAILNDPAMRLILEQMQKDPNAFKEWVAFEALFISHINCKLYLDVSVKTLFGIAYWVNS